MGRIIIVVGAALVILGAIVILLERFNINLGHLPGDIVIRSKNGTFYFPIVTCIVISAVASLVMWLLNRR